MQWSPAMASTPLLPNYGGSLSSSQCSSFPIHHRSSTILKWGWRRYQNANTVSYRTRGQSFQISATPNASPGKKSFNNQVIMVDPLEAKRLAAKQMQQIKAREKFKRQRQIEAINGAWAMIGLTAGLVIEGHTGKPILTQLADYLSAIVHFFLR
ncbi:uncharacterized protein LOC21395196 [Morus notabilis]|uniref:uncharacterized protein LOC21395196 n=1 Tax=Morus notabilis TaxID=981085 RepID=UPI000CED08F2|nr:uncharacterized protein LOC21395196 [Morus notabilis]XP_024029908.1 uncharacterized protein LOC21395196 [Morus notabilis]XP_024029909.1 uncharacterized protein LOC21395196 [Morus notabilis]